jgi:anti-sigma factor RsiW
MSDLSLSEHGPHDEAEELLPWYVTGQLDAAERARVERHLYACGACRQQLAVERRFIGEFQASSPEVESGWARLKARVQPPPPAIPARPAFFADLKSLISRPAFAALAAAQLAFVIVSGATLLSLSRPAYHALGSAPVPASGNVIVIFRSDATEQDVRATLHSAGASIVGGPTDADAYLLHVEPRQRSAALAKLQSDDLITLAQPIDGVAP